MAEMGGVRLALPKGIAAVSAPLAASRKQIKVRTNKLKREQKKWKDINRALREEQEHLDRELRGEPVSEKQSRERRKRQEILTTGLGGAYGRERRQKKRRQGEPASVNPYENNVIRVSEHLSHLPPVEDSTHTLAEIQARLRVHEEAANVADRHLEAGRREDAISQAKELAKYGNRMLATGDLGAAAHSYKRAVAEARKANDPSLVAVLLASRAEVHFASHEYKSAIADMTEAAETDPRVVDENSAQMIQMATELLESAALGRPKPPAPAPAPAPAAVPAQPEPERRRAPRPPPHSEPLVHEDRWVNLPTRRDNWEEIGKPPPPAPAPPTAKRRVSAPRSTRRRRTKPRKSQRGPLPRVRMPLLAKVERTADKALEQSIVAERSWLGLERQLHWHRVRLPPSLLSLPGREFVHLRTSFAQVHVHELRRNLTDC